MRDSIFHIFFVWYPYVCMSAFIFGSIIRFDREQYTWRASSSQLLRKKQLTWGSNLFHFGILFLLVGHTVGLLTPKAIYTLVMTVEQKQKIAIVAGGIAGAVCFVGLTLLLHRRLFDARVRQTSTYMDLAVLGISVGSTLPGPAHFTILIRPHRWLSDVDTGALGAGHSHRPAGRRENLAGTGLALPCASGVGDDDLSDLPILAARSHLVSTCLVSWSPWLPSRAHASLT